MGSGSSGELSQMPGATPSLQDDVQASWRGSVNYYNCGYLGDDVRNGRSMRSGGEGAFGVCEGLCAMEGGSSGIGVGRAVVASC